MGKKIFKYSIIAIGIAGLAYGGFRLAESIMGIIRLKYAVIHIKKFDEPSNGDPLPADDPNVEEPKFTE